MRVMVRSHAASNCVVSRGRRKARDASVGAAEVLMTSAIADISDPIAGWTIRRPIQHLWGWVANHPNTGETEVTRAVPA